MSKVAAILAVLVVLVIVVAYSQRAPPPMSVFADGEVASFSCAAPQIANASYGPARASTSCPTADVTRTVKELARKGPFRVSADALGVDGCEGTPRQLAVAFTCPATSTGTSSSTTYGASGQGEGFTGGRPLRATPYSQGPPLAEGVWSDQVELSGDNDPAQRKAVRGLPHRVLDGAHASDALTEAMRDTDAEAVGVYLPGNTHGPKREPGWAIRSGRRRTEWIP